MMQEFTKNIYSMIKTYVPNKVMVFNDKAPPWIAHQVKRAIRRKHRVFRKLLRWVKIQQDWGYFKTVRNKTTKIIATAKEIYFTNLGLKLPDYNQGQKIYWSLFNRFFNKKTVNFPALLEN